MSVTRMPAEAFFNQTVTATVTVFSHGVHVWSPGLGSRDRQAGGTGQPRMVGHWPLVRPGPGGHVTGQQDSDTRAIAALRPEPGGPARGLRRRDTLIMITVNCH